MTTYSTDVMLQFPSMSAPFRVEVTPRQLFYLDLYAERSFAEDGMVVYRLPTELRRVGSTGLSGSESQQLAA